MTLDQLVTAMAVDRHASFQAQLVVQADGKQRVITQCSGYLYTLCVCRAVPMLCGTANEQYDWLLRAGLALGWTPVDRGAALHFAQRDEYTVVAVVKSLPNGHVGMCVPTPAGQVGLWCSAAGRHTYVRCPVEQTFGPVVPAYFSFHKEPHP